MKVIVWTKYGPPEVLQLKEMEKPVPREKEVLVKVIASTVTAGDCEMRSLRFPFLLRFGMRLYNGFRAPKRLTVLGQELSGIVEEVGSYVEDFKPGDEVFAALDVGLGAYAEYTCLPEKGNGVVALKPSGFSFEEAATVPVGGLNALHFIRKTGIRERQKVLINGAGGSIGTMAVQLARLEGAEVTVVDSADKLEMLHSLGAGHVIDYKKEDFTRNSSTYDVILDVVGHRSLTRCIRALKQDGTYLMGNPTFGKMIRGAWTSRITRRRVVPGTASYKQEDLIYLRELIEEGKLRTVIDRTYPLEEIVEAHRYVESGKKSGNVVIYPVSNQ